MRSSEMKKGEIVKEDDQIRRKDDERSFDSIQIFITIYIDDAYLYSPV